MNIPNGAIPGIIDVKLVKQPEKLHGPKMMNNLS